MSKLAIPRKKTARYQKGDLDQSSVLAFLIHLRESGNMPKDILRVRGRLREAFPGIRVTKPMILAAYDEAGWSITELNTLTKKQVRIILCEWCNICCL